MDINNPTIEQLVKAAEEGKTVVCRACTCGKDKKGYRKGELYIRRSYKGGRGRGYSKIFHKNTRRGPNVEPLLCKYDFMSGWGKNGLNLDLITILDV